MVNDKADLTYIRKDRTKGSENEDIEAWDVVLDSYYKEFGLSEDYNILLELKMDLALLQNDFAITGTTFLLNKIRHLSEQVQELIDRPVEGDLLQSESKRIEY
jgi:hypothetical protein